MTPAGNGGPGPREGIVRFLDDLRAAESAAADVFEAWVESCRLAGLRGALRTIAAREATHAELLDARLAELGVAPTAAVDADVLAAAVARFASPAVSDEEKLALFLARYPDDRAAARPFDAVLAELGESDPETRELLVLVADAELATVAWLRAYLAGLARPGDGVSR